MTTTTTTTTKIRRHEWALNVDGEPRGVISDEYAEPSEQLSVGDRGYLLEICDENTNAVRFQLQDRPGRTNKSHEPEVWGWLGTNNNIARYGRGFVEVTHIGPRVIRVKEVPLVVDNTGQMMSPDEQLEELATEWRESLDAADKAKAELIAAMRDAVSHHGMSKYRIQQITQVSDLTITKWLAE